MGQSCIKVFGVFELRLFHPRPSKGNQVKIPGPPHTNLFYIFSGNASKLGDAAECPGKSFLFFLTSTFFLIVHGFLLCMIGGFVLTQFLCGMELLSGPGISLAGDWAGSSAEHHATFFVCGVRRAFGGP